MTKKILKTARRVCIIQHDKTCKIIDITDIVLLEKLFEKVRHKLNSSTKIQSLYRANGSVVINVNDLFNWETITIVCPVQKNDRKDAILTTIAGSFTHWLTINQIRNYSKRIGINENTKKQLKNFYNRIDLHVIENANEPNFILYPSFQSKNGVLTSMVFKTTTFNNDFLFPNSNILMANIKSISNKYRFPRNYLKSNTCDGIFYFKTEHIYFPDDYTAGLFDDYWVVWHSILKNKPKQNLHNVNHNDFNQSERTVLAEKTDFFTDNILGCISKDYNTDENDRLPSIISTPFSYIEKYNDPTIFEYGINVIEKKYVYTNSNKNFYIYYGTVADYAYLVLPLKDRILVNIGYCTRVGQIDSIMMDLLEDGQIKIIAKLKIL